MKRLTMSKIKEAVRLQASGLSTRKIAASLGVGHSTATDYMKRIRLVGRRHLMKIVEDRHGRRSILITSQLPVTAWHAVIDEPTFADAILDRLVHNAHRRELDGHSMRRSVSPAENVDEGLRA